VILAGIKAADYKMNLMQHQDNGKTVGCLGGSSNTYGPGPYAGAPECVGGAAFTTHGINYNKS
jgi:hypothetical protein